MQAATAGPGEIAMSPHPSKRRYLTLVLFVSAALDSHAATAAVQVYDINAWIDTTDYLFIHGSTLQWEHKTSGSPAGTHMGPEPTIINTTLDGTAVMTAVNWNQTWPDPLPADAFSSTITLLDPTLLADDSLDASVVKISGRGSLSIFQQPTAANDETLIVQFTDGSAGAAYLDAEITVLPEPTSCSCVILMTVSWLCRRRRAWGA
jgi:hypothetical protein